MGKLQAILIKTMRPLIIVFQMLFILGFLSCTRYGNAPQNLHAEATEPAEATIQGWVLSEDHKPIPGARVRLKSTSISTSTDEYGKFLLPSLPKESSFFITAWAPGYYISGLAQVSPGPKEISIVLKRHSDMDNPDYIWLSAFSEAGFDGNCQNCHAENGSTSMPFTEWQVDAHAFSAQNPRFLSMYLGQDLAGNQSPLREYAYHKDYGRFPMRPDTTQPYHGPGYKLDFPETAGTCAACHIPVAALNAPYETDPTKVSGIALEGVTCDFCHKVWAVKLNELGTPFPNMPGVLSFEFRRPEDGHQFFAGPLDDVAPGEDTYSPLQRQSQFCAPCHFGKFWDTQIYNSYGEWLESPYSSGESGKTCQDCHMPPGQNDHFVRYDRGGVTRDPSTIFSHRMPGAADQDLLQNAVSMNTEAFRNGDQIVVDVTLFNDQTGHHVPTDSPLRQMLLMVQARNAQGQALELLEGTTLPDWAGIGAPNQGYYAGLPGKGYARVLMELWTELSPTGSYWNPTRVLSDTRLAAFAHDVNRFVFSSAMDDEITIEIKLLFRRAYIELMDQKGWDVPDIVMEYDLLTIK